MSKRVAVSELRPIAKLCVTNQRMRIGLLLETVLADARQLSIVIVSHESDSFMCYPLVWCLRFYLATDAFDRREVDLRSTAAFQQRQREYCRNIWLQQPAAYSLCLSLPPLSVSNYRNCVRFRVRLNQNLLPAVFVVNKLDALSDKKPVMRRFPEQSSVITEPKNCNANQSVD